MSWLYCLACPNDIKNTENSSVRNTNVWHLFEHSWVYCWHLVFTEDPYFYYCFSMGYQMYCALFMPTVLLVAVFMSKKQAKLGSQCDKVQKQLSGDIFYRAWLFFRPLISRSGKCYFSPKVHILIILLLCSQCWLWYIVRNKQYTKYIVSACLYDIYVCCD